MDMLVLLFPQPPKSGPRSGKPHFPGRDMNVVCGSYGVPGLTWCCQCFSRSVHGSHWGLLIKCTF